MPQWITLAVQVAAGVLMVAASYEFVYRNEEYREVKSSIFKLFRK